MIPRVALFVLLATAPVLAQPAANHMLVATSTGNLAQFAPNGNLAGFYDVSSLFSSGDSTGLVMAPDGGFFAVTRDGSIKRYSSSGGLLNEFAQGDDISGIAIGPFGALYAGSRDVDAVHEYARNGSPVRTLGQDAGITGPSALAFGPNGHLYVACNGDGSVRELHPSGELVRVIGAASLTGANGLAFGRDGRLYVSSAEDDVVFVFDSEGNEVNQIGGGTLSDPSGLAFGPDENLYVVSEGDGTVYAFDGDRDLAVTFASPAPGTFTFRGHIAFVPFRFNLSVSGVKIRDQESDKSTKDTETAMCSLAPGSSRILVMFDTASEMNDTFGSDWVVLRGFESFPVDDPKKNKNRMYHGQSIGGDPVENGFTSLVARTKGKVADNGFYAIKSASGTLLRGQGVAAASGSAKAKLIK